MLCGNVCMLALMWKRMFVGLQVWQNTLKKRTELNNRCVYSKEIFNEEKLCVGGGADKGLHFLQ